MKILDKLLKKGENVVESRKGSMDPIDGIIMFIIAVVVIAIAYPIISGVITALPAITNIDLNESFTTAMGSISSGLTLIALAALVIAAVVILSIVMKLRKGE
jgi:succinate dehydrogenase/fumarate reductase cytochrome b subunit